MLVVLGPAFFGGKDSFTYDVCTRIVFFPEALRDLEVWLVIVTVGTQLFFTLDVRSESFKLSVVVPVSSNVCIKDV